MHIQRDREIGVEKMDRVGIVVSNAADPAVGTMTTCGFAGGHT